MSEESEKRFHAVMDKLFQAPSSPPNSNSKSTTNASNSLSRGGLLRDNKRPHTTTSLAVVDMKSKGVASKELRSASGGTMQTPMCRPWDRADLLKRLATFKSMTWFAKPEVVNAINCARRGWVNVDMDIIACESCASRLLFSTPSSWPQQQVENAALVFSLKLNSGHKLLCPWVDNACDEKLALFPPASLADLVDSYKRRCASLLQLSALPVISSSAIDSMRSPQLEHFLKNSSTPEHVNRSDHVSATKFLGDDSLYYQAQKLISLCGWEPRLLPYIVDCKVRQGKSARDGTHVDPAAGVSNECSPSISVYSSGPVENIEANQNSAAPGDQYDPASAVLDCGLCGAHVGLWTFCTTPWPVEFIRFIGHSDINVEDRAAPQIDNTDHAGVGASGVQAESGQHAAKIGPTPSNGRLNLTIAGGPPPAEQNFRPIISLPVVGQNLRTRFSSAFTSKGDDHQQLKALTQGSGEQNLNVHLNSTSYQSAESGGDGNGDHMSMGGANIMETETPVADKTSLASGNHPANADEIAKSSSPCKKMSEDVTIEDANLGAGDISSSEVGGSYHIVHDSDNLTNLVNGTKSDKQVISQDDGVQTVVHPVNFSQSDLGNGEKQQSAANGMQFDPIRQHRHFCPWVSSSGKSAPGWKQTLSALERQKEFFYPSTEQAPSSLIEVDDPIGSVKRLLTPPSSKRKKLLHGSS